MRDLTLVGWRSWHNQRDKTHLSPAGRNAANVTAMFSCSAAAPTLTNYFYIPERNSVFCALSRPVMSVAPDRSPSNAPSPTPSLQHRNVFCCPARGPLPRLLSSTHKMLVWTQTKVGWRNIIAGCPSVGLVRITLRSRPGPPAAQPIPGRAGAGTNGRALLGRTVFCVLCREGRTELRTSCTRPDPSTSSCLSHWSLSPLGRVKISRQILKATKCALNDFIIATWARYRSLRSLSQWNFTSGLVSSVSDNREIYSRRGHICLQRSPRRCGPQCGTRRTGHLSCTPNTSLTSIPFS